MVSGKSHESEKNKQSNNTFQDTGLGMPGRSNRNKGGYGGRHGMVPVVKPKNFKGTLARLWKYFGKEVKFLNAIFVFIMVDSGITLAVPYLIGRSIDAMSQKNGVVNFGILQITVEALAAGYVMDAVISFFQGWLMAGVSQRIVMSMRRTLFAKL